MLIIRSPSASLFDTFTASSSGLVMPRLMMTVMPMLRMTAARARASMIMFVWLVKSFATCSWDSMRLLASSASSLAVSSILCVSSLKGIIAAFAAWGVLIAPESIMRHDFVHARFVKR